MASITVNGSNSGQQITGNSNAITVSNGSFTVLVSGDQNSIRAGTGANTYTVDGFANSITLGSGGGTFTTIGSTNQVNATGGAVNGSMLGDGGTFTGGVNPIELRVVGSNNNIALPSNNANANVFLLQGDGNLINTGSGADTIAAVGANNVLTGRGGADTFAFIAGDLTFGSPDVNAPRIQDFGTGADRIAVRISANPAYAATLSGLGLSPQSVLSASQFATGAAATSAATRFVYNPADGTLRFTPFGNTQAASDLVATLANRPALSAASIFISNTEDALSPASSTSPLDGLPGGNPFSGTGENFQVITGTPGNDTFGDAPYAASFDGNLYLGDTGTDTLVVNQLFRGSTTVRISSAGDSVVNHRGHVDALRSVEAVQYLDGRLVFGIDDEASKVTRMYRAGLGRDPDQEGLNFWINSLRAGAGYGEVAGGFLGSPEFTSRFGNGLPDADFVNRIYLNVLGRAPEQSGFDFWFGRLQQGASRQDVLGGIADSNENKTITASVVQNGIWDIDESAAQVARLYDTLLNGRLPDVSGLIFYTGTLKSGQLNLQNIADQFAASDEFRQVYGSLSNRDFVQTLYQNTLKRPGDAGGVDFWTSELDRGVSRAGVAVGFSESKEHQAVTAANIRSEDRTQFGILTA